MPSSGLGRGVKPQPAGTRSRLGRGEAELAQNYTKVQHFTVLPALCRASPSQVSFTFLNSLPGIISVGNPLSWWEKAHTPFACGLHRGIPIYQAGVLPGIFLSVSPTLCCYVSCNCCKSRQDLEEKQMEQQRGQCCRDSPELLSQLSPK